jgi:DNA-binding response OmpR family regulator
VIAQSPTTPTSARLNGVRVLAVEDRPDHLALITRMLTEAGARVSGVTSAQEAFDDVHANPPDVLILDLGLPDVSGLTIVRRLRALPGAANMSIVAFTAETSSSKRDEAIKQGVEYYVMKPYFARLMHVVAHAAGR